MNKWIQQLPEGVQDTLIEQCYNRRKIESKLRQMFHVSGYDEVDTPLFEYLDLFEGETASIGQEQMYKFFEPGSRIMVLKPDYTMPIARIAATKMKEYPFPKRLSYFGNVYRYGEQGQTGQREIAQAGIELLGSREAEADAEVIALAVESLLKIGLTEFQIDIGQVEFFKGLVEEASLEEADSEKLRLLIHQKNELALEQQMKDLDISPEIKNNLLQLPMMFGNGEVLESAKALTHNERCVRALDNINQVYQILENYGLSEYIAIDLGMVQSLNYYTGIIFQGMTREMGYPICGGGRYDTLISEFGMEVPATGFALEVNRILIALERQSGLERLPGTDILFVCKRQTNQEDYKKIQEIKSEGYRVEVYLPVDNDQTPEEYANLKGIPKIIKCDDGNKEGPK
ncbi:MAG: ATP phosphoribosyltransferase regulatory subunit [Clostridiales bacterium]|nr:ATP phosphoribosyltransferase regulatory subunit [Clostridiales bacterium]